MTTRVAAGLSRAPVSLGLLAVIWVLAVITGAWTKGPSHELAAHISLGLPTLDDGYVWTLWTSGLFTSGTGGYLLASVFVLAVAVPVEQRIGSGRFAIAVFAAQGAGAALALAAARLASAVPNSWVWNCTAI